MWFLFLHSHVTWLSPLLCFLFTHSRGLIFPLFFFLLIYPLSCSYSFFSRVNVTERALRPCVGIVYCPQLYFSLNLPLLLRSQVAWLSHSLLFHSRVNVTERTLRLRVGMVYKIMFSQLYLTSTSNFVPLFLRSQVTCLSFSPLLFYSMGNVTEGEHWGHA